MIGFVYLGPVVQRVNSTINWINYLIQWTMIVIQKVTFFTIYLIVIYLIDRGWGGVLRISSEREYGRNFFLVFRDFQFQDVFALENVARTFWGGLIKLQILLEY